VDAVIDRNKIDEKKIDKDHEQDDLNLRVSKDAALDRKLDTALARYATVEPRAGLEKRILANLQAEQARIPERAWWRWSIAAAAAAIIIVAVALTLRSGRTAPQQIVQHPLPTQQGPKQAPQIAARDEESSTSTLAPARRTVHHGHGDRQGATVVASANPKLDVFPSPQPLSEQERILMSYVADFHDQAVVIARVTNEELQRDRVEMLSNTSSEESADTENTNR
jgi:hypothetical protein